MGFGTGDDGGDAARRRRRRGGGDGLAILEPRLADKGAQIDQAGRKNLAAPVDHIDLTRKIVRRQVGAEILDLAILDKDAATLLDAAFGIDQARIDEGQRRMGFCVNHGFD